MLAEYFKESQGYDYCEIDNDAFIMYRILDKELHLGHMWVRPESRRKGCAQRITTAVVQLGKQLGCEYASCVVAVNPDKLAEHTRLVRIYAEYGFDIVSAQNDMIIMKKDLI